MVLKLLKNSSNPDPPFFCPHGQHADNDSEYANTEKLYGANKHTVIWRITGHYRLYLTSSLHRYDL